MKHLRILDCTLRDGGYVNDWLFGKDNIPTIISSLINSNIDIVECGFLTDKKVTPNQTLYNSIREINDYIENMDKSRLAVMISHLKYDISKLESCNENFIKNIRYIFKKHNEIEALKNCNEIKNKGYNLFINPTYISEYSFSEFKKLIEKINKIKPYCFSLVDSIGILNGQDILKLLNYADDNLSKEISVCIHLHNNLGIAFENIRNILNTNIKRDLIIDSTIRGIGRGAGNLPLELIAIYLNKRFEANLDIKKIYKIYEKHISTIANLRAFKMENAYYYSAINRVHPNYADFLIKKNIKNNALINKILKSIPYENKIIYDENLIKKICLNN